MTRNVFLAITFTIWLYVEVSFSPLFSLLLICPPITFPLFFPSLSNVIVVCSLDCKIVRICAYSSTCKQSNKRSGTRLKPRARLGIDAKDTFFFSRLIRPIGACEDHAFRARKTLTPCFTDFCTDFERKNRLFCNLFVS